MMPPLILQAGAVGAADDLAVLVGVDRLAAGDHHTPQAALAFLDVDRLRDGGQDVAGADIDARVLVLTAAVEHAHLPSVAAGRARPSVSAGWVVNRRAQVAGWGYQRTVPLALGVSLVVED